MDACGKSYAPHEKIQGNTRYILGFIGFYGGSWISLYLNGESITIFIFPHLPAEGL